MKFKPATALAALVLIGAGGFLAGRLSFSNPPDSAKSGPIETKSTRGASSVTSSESVGGAKRTPPTYTDHVSKESSKDRLDRLETIARGENALDRNRALLAFIDQLGPENFEEAVAYFRGLGITEDRMGEYSLLLTAWAQVDPTSALAYTQANIRNGFARDTVLTTWATTDPDAAIRWAKANFSGEGANPFMPGIIRGLATTDPQKATDLLTSMPRSVERGEGLDYLLPHLMQQGDEATKSWIASITDDSLKNGAMLRAAAKLAETDPAGTASWLLANPGAALQHRLDDVYGVWASQDSTAALASFTALPAGDNRTNALRGLVTATAVNDPKAAINLMDQYSGDVSDRVVQQFIWHSFGSDPATAVTQIARITDQGQREEMYRRTLGHWIQQDPSAAQAWIQTNPIPESVQNQLLRSQATQ